MTWMGHPLLKLHDTQEWHFCLWDMQGCALVAEILSKFCGTSFFWDNAGADPRGPLRQFFWKSGKFVCWRAPPGGWRPLLRKSWIRPCNVLDGFSCFYIVIVYSNFTFCGAYMLSFLTSHTVSAKTSTPQSVADLKGGGEGCTPVPGVQILSISCSFWENLPKSYVGALSWRVGAPSSGKSWIRHCQWLQFHLEPSKMTLYRISLVNLAVTIY